MNLLCSIWRVHFCHSPMENRPATPTENRAPRQIANFPPEIPLCQVFPQRSFLLSFVPSHRFYHFFSINKSVDTARQLGHTPAWQQLGGLDAAWTHQLGRRWVARTHISSSDGWTHSSSWARPLAKSRYCYTLGRFSMKCLKDWLAIFQYIFVPIYI